MPANPLSREQIEELRASRKLLEDLKDQIRMAKAAGIDMTDREADLLVQQDKIDKLLRVYGAMPTLEDVQET